MKKQPAVHNTGFVLLVRNKHPQFASKIYSCGNGDDNSIGIWNFKDNDFSDEKSVVTLKDQCTAEFACYGNDFFVGTKHKNKQNVTQHLLFKYSFENDVLMSTNFQIATFNEKITTVDVSSNGVYVIAGSIDHSFKCLRANDQNYITKKTHDLGGAIVFISIDPTSSNFAVSTSDGKVTIFSTEDIDAEYDDILETADYKCCNAFKPEDGTCRLRVCWSSDGDELFIPSEGHIKVISTSNWTEKFIIRYEKDLLDMFCSVIYCKDAIFAINSKDKLICFNLITLKPTYEKEIEIDLVKKDNKGQLVSSIAYINNDYLAIASRTGDIFKLKCEILDSAIFDDDEGDVGKLKSQYNFNYNMEEPHYNEPSAQPVVVNSEPAILIEKAKTRGILISGSARVSTDFACLKWNAFGRIFYRVVDGDRSIEISFHDVSVHSEIILDNETSRYIFGDLNNSVVALASQKNKNGESELYVGQINSWDHENQYWATTMPSGEAIETIAVGDNFVVIYTDMRFIRIYTASGVMRFIFSVAGPLRSLVAGNCFLGLIRDSGGLIIEENEESIERQYSIDLYRVLPLNKSVLTSTHKALPLALSPESDLNWVSFTPAGNLCSMDSLFVVRYLVEGLWIPIFIGAEILENIALDTIWPISLTERNEPKFRYIYCRDRDKPNFEKVEIPETAKWTIPVENKESEKGKHEHDLLMNELLQLTSNNSSAGERSALSTSHLKMVTLLFALCCKKGRDSRSFDLAHLVESHQLAPLRAYAAKTGRINLTKKIEEHYNNLSTGSQSSSIQTFAYSQDLTNSQQERKVSLQRKRQLTNITSTMVTTTKQLNLSSTANDSLISNLTPARVERPLLNMLNTQDSLIDFSSSTQDRKRASEAESSKTSKKQRPMDDFFDSLVD